MSTTVSHEVYELQGREKHNPKNHDVEVIPESFSIRTATYDVLQMTAISYFPPTKYVRTRINSSPSHLQRGEDWVLSSSRWPVDFVNHQSFYFRRSTARIAHHSCTRHLPLVSVTKRPGHAIDSVRTRLNISLVLLALVLMSHAPMIHTQSPSTTVEHTEVRMYWALLRGRSICVKCREADEG